MRVRELFALGARGVQLGTAFAVTEEGDAAPEFKAVLAGAGPEDIVEFMSVAGLPVRAVRTPWLEDYLRHLPRRSGAAVRVADPAGARPDRRSAGRTPGPASLKT